MDHADDDLIWEVPGIAKVIRRTNAATYHLLNKGELPAKKIGGKWVASRRRLLAHLMGEAVAA